MKAINMNKSLVAASLVLALTSTTGQAKTVDGHVAFKTIADVTLSPVQDMDFGSSMLIQSGGSCEMTIGAGPDNVTAKLGQATAVSAAATYGKLTAGAQCGTDTDGTPGIYRITGAPGVEVTVTVNGFATGTNFSYVPEACAGNYTGTPGGDTCKALATSGQNVSDKITLAKAGDIGAASGTPTVGQSLIFVGGTLTALNTLTSGTPYTEQFTIDVVY